MSWDKQSWRECRWTISQAFYCRMRHRCWSFSIQIRTGLGWLLASTTCSATGVPPLCWHGSKALNTPTCWPLFPAMHGIRTWLSISSPNPSVAIKIPIESNHVPSVVGEASLAPSATLPVTSWNNAKLLGLWLTMSWSWLPSSCRYPSPAVPTISILWSLAWFWIMQLGNGNDRDKLISSFLTYTSILDRWKLTDNPFFLLSLCLFFKFLTVSHSSSTILLVFLVPSSCYPLLVPSFEGLLLAFPLTNKKSGSSITLRLSWDFSGGAGGNTISNSFWVDLEFSSTLAVVFSFPSFMFSEIAGQSLIRCSNEAYNRHLIGRLP